MPGFLGSLAVVGCVTGSSTEAGAIKSVLLPHADNTPIRAASTIVSLESFMSHVLCLALWMGNLVAKKSTQRTPFLKGDFKKGGNVAT